MLQAYQMYGDSWLYGSLVIRHKNGDSTDNSTQNIELGTVKENANDVPEHEKVRIARLAVKNLRKLTVEDVRAIRKQRISGIKLIDLADRYGVHFTTIDKICSGRTYTWVD